MSSDSEQEDNNKTALRLQKQQFYSLVDKRLAEMKTTSKLPTETQYNEYLQLLRTWEPKAKRTKKDYRIEIKYCLVAGPDSAALRKKDSMQKVATYESVFDIIHSKHEKISHARDTRKNKAAVEEEFYGVTQDVIDIYLSVCPKCAGSTKVIKAAKLNPLKMIYSPSIGCRAQMDLIDMTSHETKDGFKWILVYVDHHCGFRHVAALKRKTAKECGDALIAILGVAVIPEILQSDNGKEFLGWCLKLIRK